MSHIRIKSSVFHFLHGIHDLVTKKRVLKKMSGEEGGVSLNF